MDSKIVMTNIHQYIALLLRKDRGNVAIDQTWYKSVCFCHKGNQIRKLSSQKEGDKNNLSSLLSNLFWQKAFATPNYMLLQKRRYCLLSVYVGKHINVSKTGWICTSNEKSLPFVHRKVNEHFRACVTKIILERIDETLYGKSSGATITIVIKSNVSLTVFAEERVNHQKNPKIPLEPFCEPPPEKVQKIWKCS